MSIASGMKGLSSIHSLPFGSRLAQLVATIEEVQPAGPSSGGSSQMIRVGADGCMAVDVMLFDQPQAITQSATNSIIRFSAHPSSAKALIWERSKAARGPAKAGVLVARRTAKIEIYSPAQAETLGIRAQGFVPVAAEPTLDFELPADAAPAPVTSKPAALPTPPSVSAVATAPGLEATVEVARRVAACLDAARTALGPQANSDDVRFTAKVTFDEVYSKKEPHPARAVA